MGKFLSSWPALALLMMVAAGSVPRITAAGIMEDGLGEALKVLHIEPGTPVTWELVKKQYRKRALELHPDKHRELLRTDPPAFKRYEDEFKQLTSALDIMETLFEERPDVIRRHNHRGGPEAGSHQNHAQNARPYGNHYHDPSAGSAVARFDGTGGFEFRAAYRGEAGYVVDAAVNIGGSRDTAFYWVPNGENTAHRLIFGRGVRSSGSRLGYTAYTSEMLDTRYPSGLARFTIEDGVLKVGDKTFHRAWELQSQSEFRKVLGDELKPVHIPREGDSLGLYRYQLFRSPSGEIMILAQPQKFNEADYTINREKVRLFSYQDGKTREFSVKYNKDRRAYSLPETGFEFTFFDGQDSGIPEFDDRTGIYFGERVHTNHPLTVRTLEKTTVAELAAMPPDEARDLRLIQVLKDRIPIPAYLRTPLDGTYFRSVKALVATPASRCLTTALFGMGK